jgi:hypothetical protein
MVERASGYDQPNRRAARFCGGARRRRPAFRDSSRSIAADTSGLQTPIGRLEDDIERPTSPEDDALILRIPAVSSAIARMLDAIVDDGDGGMKGKVLFAASVSDTTSVRYRVIPRQPSRC